MTAPIASLQRAVAQHYQLPHRVMTGRDQSHIAIRARQVCMYLAHTVLGKGPCEIGRRFQRDHSTVMHNVRRVASIPELLAEAVDIEQKRISAACINL